MCRKSVFWTPEALHKSFKSFNEFDGGQTILPLWIFLINKFRTKYWLPYRDTGDISWNNMGDNFITKMFNYYYRKGIWYRLQIKEFESSLNLKSSTAKINSSLRINNYSKYLTLTINLELLDIIYLFCNLSCFPHFIYFKILSAEFHINTEFHFFMMRREIIRNTS